MHHTHCVLPFMLLTGCALFRSSAENTRIAAAESKHERCVSSIAMYLPNQTLPAPHRVIGRVEGSGRRTEKRWRQMKEKACRLGGDAMISVAAGDDTQTEAAHVVVWALDAPR
jgi:hypothetical protein